MGKAILRVAGIKTTSDLSGVGKHHIDRISETNKDIDLYRSSENITLKSAIGGTYGDTFDFVVRDLKNQHEKQMESTRESRRKSFRDKVNEDKADVACEFMMSASPEYFEGKSHKEVREWAETSLKFVTDKIGINKDNVLHAVVHMDEKTPHLHVVAVPLVEKYDGRKKENVLAISRKHFITTRQDMANVQTNYVEFMNEKGFDLERGMEKSGGKHLDVARYKVKTAEEKVEQLEQQVTNLSGEKEKLEKEKEAIQKEKELLEKKVEEISKKQTELVKKTWEIHTVFEERLSLEDDVKSIKERVEPVKTLFGGKDKEPTVKLPQKDFEQLIAYAERGVGAEIIVAAEKAKNGELKLGHSNLVEKHNQLVGKYNQYLDKSKALLAENQELKKDLGQTKGSLKKAEKDTNRLASFILKEDLGDKFKDWNAQINRQQQQEKSRKDFGMER